MPIITDPRNNRIIQAPLEEPKKSTKRRVVVFTPREKQVLNLAITGKTNAQIADILFKGKEYALKFHTDNIRGKLNAPTFAEAVTFAKELDLTAKEIVLPD